MSYKEILKEHLIDEEGIRRVPYLDTKKIWTVGIGHNMIARPLPPNWKYPLTDAQIDQLFQEDIADADKQARKVFADVWETWSDNRRAGVVDLVFNLGIGTFLTFGPTIEHMRKGEWQDVKYHLEHSAWFSQVATRGPKVVRLIVEG